MKNIKTLLLGFFISAVLFNNLNADNYVDSLKRVLKTSKEEDKIVILNDIADYYLDYSLVDARKYAIKAIILSQKFNNKKEEAFSNKVIGYFFYYQNNYDSAIFYFEKSLDLYQIVEYKKGISDVYTSLGRIYNKKGEIYKAIEFYNKSVLIDEELGNDLDKAITYNDIGKIYVNVNDYSKALKYFQKSITVFKKEKDEIYLATVYANIGNVYYNWQKYKEALVYIDYALKVFTKKDMKYKIADLLSNKGMVYESMGEYEKSFKLLNEALAINIEIENDLGIFNCNGNIAKIKEKKQDYAAALKIYKQILIIAEKIDYKKGYISTLNNIGNIEYKLGNFESAKVNIQKALDLSLQTGMLTETMLAYQYLADVFNSSKEYSKSVEYYKEYIIFKDSIFNLEILSKVTEFNTKYELEKKENDILQLSTQNKLQNVELVNQKNQKIFFTIISILILIIGFLIFLRFLNQRKTNKILEDKNSQLFLLNNTKDKFFSIIAHDLKNPLSAFRSITESLSENINIIEKNELEQYLNKLYNSSNNLYILLQNLLQWATSQTGKMISKPDYLNLNTIVIRNINLLKAFAQQKNIQILNQITDDAIVYVDEKMIDTVIRNLLTNAIKFTNAGGEIKMYCTKNEYILTFYIQDNGIGMTAEDLTRILKIEEDTSTIGNSADKGTGLGLILCKELVEKNNGKIFVQSELTKGSTFILELALNP